MTNRLTLDRWELSALLLDDDAEERSATLLALQGHDERRRLLHLDMLRDASEWQLLQRNAAEREAERLAELSA